jgi:transposase
MNKRIAIQLSLEDRAALRQLRRRGKRPARILTRAQILLLVDAGYSAQEIRAIVATSASTIWRTKIQYQEGGLAQALNESAGQVPRPG